MSERIRLRTKRRKARRRHRQALHNTYANILSRVFLKHRQAFLDAINTDPDPLYTALIRGEFR